MSVRKAMKFYKELSPQQKRFVDTKTMGATFPIRKWQGFLAKAVAFDEYGDAARKKMRNRAVLCWVLAVVFAFIALVSENWMFLLGSLPLIGIAIYLGAQRKKFRNLDLNNYLRLLFFPLLEVLKDRAGEDAKLEAQLDFRDPSEAQERKKYQQNNRNFEQYAQQHVSARTTLKDTVQFELTVIDDIREVKFTKRSASGKTKHKHKHKISHVFFIKLAAPKPRFSIKGDIPDEVAVEDREDAVIIKLKRKIKTDVKDHILSMKSLLKAIEKAYSVLQYSGGAGDEEGDDYEYEEYDNNYDMIVWSGATYSSMDYDSFESEGGGFYDGGDSESFFDS